MAKFEMGQMLMTSGISYQMESVKGFAQKIIRSLTKYAHGDWGETCEEDKEANDMAVKSGNDRIVAKYDLGNDDDIFIITEWDRSYTTVMLCSEY